MNMQQPPDNHDPNGVPIWLIVHASVYDAGDEYRLVIDGDGLDKILDADGRLGAIVELRDWCNERIAERNTNVQTTH